MANTDPLPTYDDDQVADLRTRLRATRWVDQPATSTDLGVDLDALRDLVAYWADGFDFDAHRDRLGALPRRRVDIDGLGIHLLHARADAPGATPLLLAHGWPDSGWRYRTVLPLLTTGDPAFDVVVPDMPGFGFSDRPPGDIPDSRRVAALWAELMTQLGYDRFAVSGGDVGSHVARYLALDHPERILWIHRTDAGIPVFDGDPAELGADERAFLDAREAWRAREGGYIAEQTTKPQTLASGLTDSPAGMAAWILEKLVSWSDRTTPTLTRDDILELLTEYWMTETIGASVRMYLANAAIPREQLARRVDAPSGFSIFAGDIMRAPRAWLDRVANTVYAAEPQHGGHFAAREQPAAYAAEVRATAAAVAALAPVTP